MRNYDWENITKETENQNREKKRMRNLGNWYK
jgi:hypothetical protein